MNEGLGTGATGAERIGVMQGRLSDFDLAQVLQVVGIGRQYVGVEVHNNNAVAGTIYVKSGKVVSASAAGKQGKEAFFALFQQGGGSFYVFRSKVPHQLPEPIGALSGLMVEALSIEPVIQVKQAEPSVPPTFKDSEFPTQNGVAPPAPGSAPVAQQAVASPAAVPPAVAPGAATPSTAVEGHRNNVELATASHAPIEPSIGVSQMRPPALAASGSEQRRVVAIASPKGGCGKTTVSLNLALALARQGRSVLLVDADINGDILSSVNARERADAGVFDILRGTHGIQQTLLKTMVPGFSIVPAIGKRLPGAELFLQDHTERWRQILGEASSLADLVLIDTPAGMFGTTHQILAASTHVLGVLQAEVLASRSFSRFAEGLDAIPHDARPKIAGVFLNMVQMRQAPSLSVLQDACASLPAGWLFDTSIPHSPAFLQAADQGLPLRHLDELAPPAVAFLFDNLAAEAAQRLDLQATERKPRQFLL